MNDEMMVMADLRREGIAMLVAAFYRRVKEDDLVGPMYPPEDWEGAEARLRDFLLFRLGGDPTYLNERGHPRLRMRHQPFRIDIAARDRWLTLMGEAMDECAIPATSRPFLDDFFRQIADFMRNVEG
jgi:hemoglobin